MISRTVLVKVMWLAMLGAVLPIKAEETGYRGVNLMELERLVNFPPVNDGLTRHFTMVIRDHLFKIAQTHSDPRVKERAIGLAWACSVQYAPRGEVALMDMYLRYGEVSPRDEGYTERVERAIQNSSERSSLAECVEKLMETDAVRFRKFAGLLQRLEREISEERLSDAGPLLMEESEYVSFWAELQPSEMQPDRAALVDSRNEVPRVGSESAPIEMGPPLKSKQSSLHGLLVIELEGSNFAGGASKMNATAVGSRESRNTKFGFNQEVGELMSGALNEVENFLRYRHSEMPEGYEIKVSFEDRHVLKDGPSAAVACSLLLDSLITGDPLDVNFAVTGDMNVDGQVQPVGGIDGKIRGAIRSGCTHVAIPRENLKSLSDMYILSGIRPFFEIQIFSIGDFEEARALALHTDGRSEEVAEAMKLFSEVVDALKRAGSMTILTNPHVTERLKKVISLMPNHESAKLLLLQGAGRTPRHLSLAGSFNALDRCSSKVWMESGKFTTDINVIKDTVGELRRLRNTLDPRTKPALDALQDMLSGISTIEDQNPTPGSSRFNEMYSNIKNAANRLDQAYEDLRANPEVQEELNY